MHRLGQPAQKSFSQNQYLGSVMGWEGRRAFPVRYISLEIAFLDGNRFNNLREMMYASQRPALRQLGASSVPYCFSLR